MLEPRVWLVGAGPGDPELLTLKAARLIAAADIILHDALVTPGLLALANPAAELIAVGKRAGAHSMPQMAIDAALVAAARRGGRVVRLKGGDPGMFGRLDEEMAALRRAGIGFAIVPGVTAACTAAAAAQVSLSRRGVARRVSFVTGHARANEPLTLDWATLADPQTTLVIYMGRGAAGTIAAALVAHGLAAATPVAVVADASLATQTVARGTLTDLGALADTAGDRPATLLVGAALDNGYGISRATISSAASSGVIAPVSMRISGSVGAS